MRWVVFVILAYVMMALQIGAARQLQIGPAQANFVVLAVIFVCINTTREAALTCALGLGLMQDLLTIQAPGIYGFSYGLVGLVCATTNRNVYPDHPLTHVFYAFVAQIVTSAVMLVHNRLYNVIHPADAFVLEAGPLVWSALYTAAVAPVVLGVLSRVKGVFGFKGVNRGVRPYT